MSVMFNIHTIHQCVNSINVFKAHSLIVIKIGKKPDHVITVAQLNVPSHVARTSSSRQQDRQTQTTMESAYAWVPGCDGGTTKLATHNIQALHTPHAYANSIVVLLSGRGSSCNM